MGGEDSVAEVWKTKSESEMSLSHLSDRNTTKATRLGLNILTVMFKNVKINRWF